MPEENKKKIDFDIFIAKSIYPDAASIFTSDYKSLEDIKNNCYIVLDTNVLLAPYIIGKDDPGGKEDLLNQCKKTYETLLEQKRLIIPAQVAREFAKNRVNKLAELYQQLSQKKQQTQKITKGKYPLLYSLNEYQEVENLEKEINKKIMEYQNALDRVLIYIQQWQINDPVRSLYNELFNENTVFDPNIDEEEIRKDLDHRVLHHIPPGYKDAGKEDNGIGDLLIWHTILEIGRIKKQSVIFVSGDAKPDWFHRSEKTALYVRHELIEEFRRHSEGNSLHIVKFWRFLELYGAQEEIIKRVKNEETQEEQYNNDHLERQIHYFHQLRQVIIFFINHCSPAINEDGLVIDAFHAEFVIKNAKDTLIYLNNILLISENHKLFDTELNEKIRHLIGGLQILAEKNIILDEGQSLREFSYQANTVNMFMGHLLGETRNKLLQ